MTGRRLALPDYRGPYKPLGLCCLCCFMLFVWTTHAVYAVYAISSLDTGLPLRPRARIAVGTHQGVAGLAPRLPGPSRWEKRPGRITW